MPITVQAGLRLPKIWGARCATEPASELKMRGAHGAPYGLFTQTVAIAMLFAPERRDLVRDAG